MYRNQSRSSFSHDKSSCPPIPVDSKLPSTFSPGVDHQLIGLDRTNSRGPQQVATPSGEMYAMQCEDRATDRSFGFPFRHNDRHCYNIEDYQESNNTHDKDAMLPDIRSQNTNTGELPEPVVVAQHSNKLGPGSSQTMPACLSGRSARIRAAIQQPRQEVTPSGK